MRQLLELLAVEELAEFVEIVLLGEIENMLEHEVLRPIRDHAGPKRAR